MFGILGKRLAGSSEVTGASEFGLAVINPTGPRRYTVTFDVNVRSGVRYGTALIPRGLRTTRPAGFPRVTASDVHGTSLDTSPLDTILHFSNNDHPNKVTGLRVKRWRTT